MKKKVVIVAGTRPEVIKMVPVHFALKASSILDPFLLTTAQHRQMLDQALQAFNVTPDFDLDLMEKGQTLTDLTAKLIPSVARFLREFQPDAMLVQGDTTTVFSSSIAAFYERIPIGHVEAGLRTYDMSAPYPEEMNRRLVDPIANWCFAPTQASADNLIREQIPKERVHVTGNTVIDALLWMKNRLNHRGVSVDEVVGRCLIPPAFFEKFLKKDNSNLNQTNVPRFMLVTGHRRESFGGGFERICLAINELSIRYPDVGILYPVHLNPHVQEPVNRILGNNPNVALVPPVAYEDFIWLMDHCYFVLSDSGGVQEEAPSLGKPVLVMRETTERPEGVSVGTCVLVGTDPRKILREASILIEDEGEYQQRSALKNPFGDGAAASRICEILERDLG